MMIMELSAFHAQAAAWLADHADRRTVGSTASGRGSDDVSVFHDLTDDQERDLLDRLMAWQQVKFDAGYGAIAWPAAHGGAGLSNEHVDAFVEEESAFDVPSSHRRSASRSG